MPSKKMKKGQEGKGTGKSAKALIKKAKEKGYSNEEIGKATNRDGATISDIARGEIKNPPNSLIPQLRKVASKATKKAKKKRK